LSDVVGVQFLRHVNTLKSPVTMRCIALYNIYISLYYFFRSLYFLRFQSTALSPYASKRERVYQVASIFYCVSVARGFAAAFLPFPVGCPRRSMWRGEARAVEVYVLPLPAPCYPLWGAQSRGVTSVVYCRSRVFNVAVADASIYLGVRLSAHKFLGD